MNTFYAQDKRILDSFGRERIFNGMNVCDKGSLNESSMKRVYAGEWDSKLPKTLKEHGFDLVRLGITWDAVEPQPGQYNDDFLAKVKKNLDMCYENGIFVYLDIHQDLYAACNSSGDGAPDWASDPGKYEFKKAKFVWAEGYFWGKGVHQAFDNFWENNPVCGKGLQDWFADMWTYVIKTLGSHPAVIGYDFFNEPFPGKSGGKVFKGLIKNLVKETLFNKNISKKFLIKTVLGKEKERVLDAYSAPIFRKITSAGDSYIKEFDTKRYFPFISKMTGVARKIEPKALVFMENSYYSNLGIPYSCPVPEVDGKKDSNVVFSPHAYDLMVDTPAYKYASDDRVGSIFAQRRQTQEKLNVPVIVGEWGGYSEGNDWFPHVKFLLNLFDSYKWSQTYWAYFPELLESELFNDVLTRPRPIAVTGEIEAYCYNWENDMFTLSYKQDRDYNAPTEIFVHKAVKSIEVNGEYEIVPMENSQCSVVKITSHVGENKVHIQF